MSTKATGSVFAVPDKPVARYSPEMEACFEMLHRTVSRGTTIPDSIDSIFGLVTRIRELYYIMRDHFEADDGISVDVAKALPPVEITPLLKTLSKWECDPDVGCHEFERRDTPTTASPLYSDSVDRFHSFTECWNHYRLWMFEANRALTICRRRVASDAPKKQPRRYDWLS